MKQQTLFSDSQTFQKERPTKPTEQQKKAFYLKMAKEVIENNWSDSDADDIAKDLEGLYTHSGNGYEMARSLDDYSSSASYEIDTEFCEWLEHLHWEYREVKDENVKAWVKAHDIKPEFEKGQKLTIKEPLCRGMDKGMVYVNGFYLETACYIIDPCPDSNGGTILPYEKVESRCEKA